MTYVLALPHEPKEEECWHLCIRRGSICSTGMYLGQRRSNSSTTTLSSHKRVKCLTVSCYRSGIFGWSGFSYGLSHPRLVSSALVPSVCSSHRFPWKTLEKYIPNFVCRRIILAGLQQDLNPGLAPANGRLVPSKTTPNVRPLGKIKPH
jgi:hypothetical protein